MPMPTPVSYSDIIGIIDRRDVENLMKVLPSLKSSNLKPKEEFFLLDRAVTKYNDGYFRAITFKYDDLQSLQIIKLLIKNLPLKITKKMKKKLWFFIDTDIQPPSQELINILFSKKSLRMFANNPRGLIACIQEGIKNSVGGCLANFYFIQERYRHVLDKQIMHLGKQIIPQNTILEIVLKQILNVFTGLDNTISPENLRGSDAFYILKIMQKILMLCMLSFKYPINIGAFTASTEIEKICKKDFSKENNNELSNYLHDFFQLIHTMIVDKALFKSTLYPMIIIIQKISEHFINNLTEQTIIMEFDRIDAYKYFEIYSYAGIIAKNLKLKVDVNNNQLYKDKVMKIIGNKNPYLEFLVELTHKRVNTEMKKWYLACNRSQIFADVLIRTAEPEVAFVTKKF